MIHSLPKPDDSGSFRCDERLPREKNHAPRQALLQRLVSLRQRQIPDNDLAEWGAAIEGLLPDLADGTHCQGPEAACVIVPGMKPRRPPPGTDRHRAAPGCQ
jgi:hypothetical protein